MIDVRKLSVASCKLLGESEYLSIYVGRGPGMVVDVLLVSKEMSGQEKIPMQ